MSIESQTFLRGRGYSPSPEDLALDSDENDTDIGLEEAGETLWEKEKKRLVSNGLESAAGYTAEISTTATSTTDVSMTGEIGIGEKAIAGPGPSTTRHYENLFKKPFATSTSVYSNCSPLWEYPARTVQSPKKHHPQQRSHPYARRSIQQQQPGQYYFPPNSTRDYRPLNSSFHPEPQASYPDESRELSKYKKLKEQLESQGEEDELPLREVNNVGKKVKKSYKWRNWLGNQIVLGKEGVLGVRKAVRPYSYTTSSSSSTSSPEKRVPQPLLRPRSQTIVQFPSSSNPSGPLRPRSPPPPPFKPFSLKPNELPSHQTGHVPISELPAHFLAAQKKVLSYELARRNPDSSSTTADGGASGGYKDLLFEKQVGNGSKISFKALPYKFGSDERSDHGVEKSKPKANKAKRKRKSSREGGVSGSGDGDGDGDGGGLSTRESDQSHNFTESTETLMDGKSISRYYGSPSKSEREREFRQETYDDKRREREGERMEVDSGLTIQVEEHVVPSLTISKVDRDDVSDIVDSQPAIISTVDESIPPPLDEITKTIDGDGDDDPGSIERGNGGDIEMDISYEEAILEAISREAGALNTESEIIQVTTKDMVVNGANADAKWDGNDKVSISRDSDEPLRVNQSEMSVSVIVAQVAQETISSLDSDVNMADDTGIAIVDIPTSTVTTTTSYPLSPASGLYPNRMIEIQARARAFDQSPHVLYPSVTAASTPTPTPSPTINEMTVGGGGNRYDISLAPQSAPPAYISFPISESITRVQPAEDPRGPEGSTGESIWDSLNHKHQQARDSFEGRDAGEDERWQNSQQYHQQPSSYQSQQYQQQQQQQHSPPSRQPISQYPPSPPSVNQPVMQDYPLQPASHYPQYSTQPPIPQPPSYPSHPSSQSNLLPGATSHNQPHSKPEPVRTEPISQLSLLYKNAQRALLDGKGRRVKESRNMTDGMVAVDHGEGFKEMLPPNMAGGARKYWQCDECGKTSLRRTQMRQHVRLHKIQAEKGIVSAI